MLTRNPFELTMLNGMLLYKHWLNFWKKDPKTKLEIKSLFWFIKFSFTVPSAAPGNFTALNVSSTVCFLKWENVPRYERNGFILGYRLKWKMVGNSEEFLSSTDQYTKNYTLLSLEEATLYEISIWAYNSKGTSSSVKTVYCQTLDDCE